MKDIAECWRMVQNEWFGSAGVDQHQHMLQAQFCRQEKKNRLDQKRKEQATCTAYAIPLNLVMVYGQ